MRLDLSHVLPHPDGVRSLKTMLDAERKMKELLEHAGLPAPDRVEYGDACVRFIWWEPKAVVVIDLD
jgi:hypothetical protein